MNLTVSSHYALYEYKKLKTISSGPIQATSTASVVLSPGVSHVYCKHSHRLLIYLTVKINCPKVTLYISWTRVILTQSRDKIIRELFGGVDAHVVPDFVLR